MHYSHMAEHVRSKGRGDDTMLVHMTPHEVGGLQALAMAHGGSLTINPDTGLPEAGWLGKLLPTILGGIGMAFGIPPVWMGALGAVGGTAVTGNLKEGLMAGLGAFGGASMAGAVGAGGALGHAGSSLGLSGSGAAVMHPVAAVGSAAKDAAAQSVLSQADKLAPEAFQKLATETGKQFIQPTGVIGGFGQAAKAGLSGPVGGLVAKAAVPAATMGALQAANAFTPTPKPEEGPAPSEYGYTGTYNQHRANLQQPAGGAPVANQLPVQPTMQPFNPMNFDSSEKTYFGPTTYTDASGNPWIPGQKTTPGGKPQNFMQAWDMFKRGLQPSFADGGQVGANQMMSQTQTIPQPAQPMMGGSYSMQGWQPQYNPYAAQNYTQPNNPVPDNSGGIRNLPGLASGGTLHMRSGSFVMPARETAEFGNGSSSAGQQVLARLGGTPIHGPGDGVSDSIHARINGNQKARVARDEVHFSPEAVARLGGGDSKKGTQKLYALMNKAQQARKSAKRGQDTGLRAIA